MKHGTGVRVKPHIMKFRFYLYFSTAKIYFHTLNWSRIYIA